MIWVTGKTALVSEIAKKLLDVKADSPTFSLVNEYKGNGMFIYHFDLYRLSSVEEIEEIGFWEYIDSGHPCFIEWPEKIAELLPPEKCMTIHIELTLNQCREYSIALPSS